nr:hypothetical protein [Rhodopirellula sp. SM50]
MPNALVDSLVPGNALANDIENVAALTEDAIAKRGWPLARNMLK